MFGKNGLQIPQTRNSLISPISSSLSNLIYEFETTQDTIPEEEAVGLKRPNSPFKVIPRKRRMSNHSNLAKTTVGLRELAKKIGEAPLTWEKAPKYCMIVSKLSDSSMISLTLDVASWLMGQGLQVFVQKKLYDLHKNIPTAKQEIWTLKTLHFWEENEFDDDGMIDFVITLGGDGTVLYASWLFQQKAPPIIPFNLGSLGFLTVFNVSTFEQTIKNTLDCEHGMRMNFRMRFSCTIHRGLNPETNRRGSDHGNEYQVLNDLVVDRGPSPFLSQLELYGNKSHLTTVQADGLVISTPTGSTAYSLSAGGSVVHPDVSAILVTPICPHTLSFRPMILPDTMDIRVLVPSDSRATAWVSFDGRHRVHLQAGDSIQIVSSPFPIPTLCKAEQSEDWFLGLERCLAWNTRERQKALE